MNELERPRFAADEMLGSLAKWLRIIGYDTTYCKGLKDEEIARRALAEQRVLLTRDRELADRTDGAVYVVSDVLVEQMRQVADAFHLHFDEEMTRCALCNGRLMKVDKESVMDDVPPRSLQFSTEFYRCDSCGKVYWKGTHWKNIQERAKDFGLQDRSLL